jgi:hypothetical protein
MSEMDKWLELLTGLVSPEEAEPMISEALTALDEFLQRDPRTMERVVDILNRRLSGEFNAETWKLMHDSLCQYFTEDLACLLYWVVDVENAAASRLYEVERYGLPNVMAFLRAVVGIFGVDLTNAFILWNQIPNNWRTIYRDVYFDRINERQHIKLRILKYSGEEVVIEGPPDSILSLGNELIFTSRLVGAREDFSESTIKLYLEESKELTKLLKGGKKGTPA